MPDATYAIPNFLGGCISQFAQGRFDRPDYRVSLNVCLNSFPVEIGTWTRRPGSQFAGTSRGGAQSRVIKFDFEQAAPYTIELTAGFMRFRSGPAIATTNDQQAVVAISSANPAVVQTTSTTTWATGNTLIFGNLGTTAPLLQNRQFVATKVDTTHFSLADAITGATIDGSTLGAIAATTVVSRVQEVVSPYVATQLQAIRPVQAETQSILLHGSVAPQVLSVTALPADGLYALFGLSPASFLDGPYLDPVPGALATPSAATGNITVTLTFQAYSSTQAYKKGDFVSSSGVSYQSLQDSNAGNTPASSATFWAVVSPALAVGPNGIVQTDVGRHIRFNDSAGDWTWGKITGLSTTGFISPSGQTPIGNLTGNGGLPAIFDGVISKTSGLCGIFQQTFAASFVNIPIDLFAGLHFTSGHAISYAYLVPSSDLNLVEVFGASTISNITVLLRGSNSSPGTPSSGTLLGSVLANYNSNAPILVTSNDQVSTWNYVWFEISFAVIGTLATNMTVDVFASQIQFYGSISANAGTIFTVELLGPALPNTTSVIYRLGAFSDTTKWPTCGVYDGGRLWLGGAVDNRFDASVSNGIVGTSINFAPTEANGQVVDSSAISYTLNSDGVNPIFWMQPDLQGLIFGTQAGEWLVQAPTAGPITPTNISARRVTKIGCANVEPRRTEHTNVFVQRFSRKLMEYFADVYSGKFSAPNIADKAEHITLAGIAELAYQQAVTPIIWGRDALGALFGVTYKRDTLTTAQGPTFAAWHQHALGSGRIVESICAGPSVGGDLDALTMVTNNPTSNIRHVELLTDTMDETTALVDSWFLDGAVNPTSVSSSATGLTINGLWHFNGKTVQVFAGGLDCGDPGEGKPVSDFIVTNGSLFIPYGDSISAGAGRGLFTAAFATALPLTQIIVGFTYNSDGQMVRPIAMADTGARNGPALGKIRRNHRYAMLLSNSLGLSVGAIFTKMYPAQFRDASGNAIAPLTTFSGVQQDSLNDDYGYDGMMCWRVSRPWPANVVAISGNLQTQDQ